MASSVARCSWAGSDALYHQYHDEEWGVPVHDDKTLFEFLILEGAQAGLSWITILKRREGYRQAFDDFDYKKIAAYSEEKIEQLIGDERIIRNKLKIRSSVKNAKIFMEIQKEFGSFNDYIWSFVNGEQVVNRFQSMADVPASTPLSDEISKDLKKRGMSFVGTTIMYAYLQAVGVVNDHTTECFLYNLD